MLTTQKIFKAIFTLCIVTICIVTLWSCSEDKSDHAAANSQFEEKMDPKLAINFSSLEDAKNSLAEQTQALAMIERMSSMKMSLDISIISDTSENTAIDTRYNDNVLSIPNEAAHDAYIAEYLANTSASFNQISKPPSSTISIYVNFDMEQSGVTKSISMKSAAISSIEYLNGTVKDYQLLDNEVSEKVALFSLDTAKIIDTLKLDSEFEFPLSYQEIFLSKQDPEAFVEDQEIVFKLSADNAFELKYPAALKSRLIAVEALDAKGKSLQQRNYSGITLPNPDTMDYLITVNQAYQSALSQLKKGKLDSLESLKYHLAQELPLEHKKIVSISTGTYKFYGPVASVRLVLANKQKKSLKKSFAIKNTSIARNKTGFFPAYDESSDLYGLIDMDGSWMIPPSHQDLSYLRGRFFENMDSGKYFLLNTNNRTLQEFDYEPDWALTDELWAVKVKYADRVENDYNINGVISLAANKIIIPSEYYDIAIKGDFLIVQKRSAEEYLYGVFDLKGNLLLEPKYRRITATDNYLYAHKVIDNDQNFIQVFDHKGKQITEGRWGAVGTYSENRLLLVANCKEQYEKKHDHTWYDCKHKFINQKGETAISLEQYKYKNINVYSNGYAAIQNQNGLWGYLNTQGKLVIPFKYKGASSFEQKYAMVTTVSGDSMLIDVKQKVFKNFKDTIVQTYYKSGEPSIYTLKNGSKYNGNGVLVLKEDNK